MTAFMRRFSSILLWLVLSNALAQDGIEVQDASDSLRRTRVTDATIDDSGNLNVAGSITLDGLTQDSLIYPDSAGLLTSLGAATNGQLPIGSTGATPVLAGITGTTNQVTVTNGAGSITLSTPQDTHAGASPLFTGLTLSGLSANQLIRTNASAALTSVGAATNGQIPIGSTGAAPVLAAITGTTNRVTVTNGAGTITLSGPQDIHTGASPTFVGATLSGLTNKYVPYSASGALSGDAGLQYDATNDDLEMSGTGANSGILLGGDTRIYRSAAATFSVVNDIVAFGTISTPQLGDTQVGYGNASNELQSEAAFTYDPSTDELNVIKATIGSSDSPAADLHIYGSATDALLFDGGTFTEMSARGVTNAGGLKVSGGVLGVDSAVRMDLNVNTRDLTSGNRDFRLMQGANDLLHVEADVGSGTYGYVGIDDSTPSYELDVNGSVQIQSPGILRGSFAEKHFSYTSATATDWMYLNENFKGSTSFVGWPQSSAGSITDITVSYNTTAHSVSGTFTAQAYVNASTATISATSNTISSTASDDCVDASAARGTYTFSDKDRIQVKLTFNGSLAATIHVAVTVRVIHDA